MGDRGPSPTLCARFWLGRLPSWGEDLSLHLCIVESTFDDQTEFLRTTGEYSLQCIEDGRLAGISRANEAGRITDEAPVERTDPAKPLDLQSPYAREPLHRNGLGTFGTASRSDAPVSRRPLLSQRSALAADLSLPPHPVSVHRVRSWPTNPTTSAWMASSGPPVKKSATRRGPTASMSE